MVNLGYVPEKKVDPNHDAHWVQSKRLLQGLELASDRKQLRGVLKIACISFDHNRTEVHDDEMQTGAATMLYECLYLNSFSNPVDAKEAERICQLLNMVYRCSDPVAVMSFCEIGSQLIQLLLHTCCCTNSTGLQASAEALIQRLTSLDIPISSLINYQNLLYFLIRTLNGNSNTWVILHTAKVLAGLTTHPQGKLVTFKCPGLLQAVVTLVAKHQECSDIRFEAAKTFSNLAWDAQTRVEMVRNKSCIAVLVKLCQDSPTQFPAMQALQHLAAESSNTNRLVLYEKGTILRLLLTSIKNEDICVEVQLASMGTMCALISRETAHYIGGREPMMFHVLADHLSSAKKGPQSALSNQILLKFATYIHVNHTCHEVFIQFLLQLSYSTDDCAKLTVASKALAQQSLLGGNSFYMVRCTDVLQALSNLASKKEHARVQANALEALAHLAHGAFNAKKLVHHPLVMEILVEVATTGTTNEKDSSRPKDSSETARMEARRYAIEALLTIAAACNNSQSGSHSHPQTNLKRCAKQMGLVAALAAYGISNDDSVQLKRDAIEGVLLLAPFL